MTIENLKQIAIKYATTKGSCVPLAPDELCNAVVQYFNEFLKITADINTIQVAVTEEGGNIVFTITGNTLDGKAFTPIVITVDHNDFVTNQEFEEFKTSVTKQLNNKRSVISSPASSYVVYTQANGLESNLPYSELANQTSTNIMARRANGTSDVKKGISGENVANMENIAEINSTLNNKLDKITSPISSGVLYANINGNDKQISYTSSPVPNTVLYRDSTGKTSVLKGISGQNVANMENIADVVAKIPDVSGFATTSEVSKKLDKTGGTINGDLTVEGNINTSVYKSRGAEVIDLDFSNTRFNVGNTRYGINIFSSNRPTVTIGESISNIVLENDIPKYTSVDSVIYDTTNGAIIAYDGANEIHIPLLAGENVTIDASEDNKKIVISAAGGGVTAAGNNTFTGVNTFYNSIYAKNGVVAEGTTNYGANSIMKGSNTYSFPNKSGTFAMTTDVIKDPIYFISFYANELSEPCHLIGTMMSKNSYRTGQKTNEEFAVMLADNFYTNSNEGLAAYGRLAGKNILCIYSEDGLSIRCLDDENSEVDLPTVMFFVMETEL